MKGGKSSRSDRVAERLKAELMDLLLRGAVRDPALADAYVTQVRLTADLRHARIYFRLTRSNVDDSQRDAALTALARAGGYLRKELGAKLQLKYMPDLKFFWDEGLDRAARVDELLAEVRRDRDGDESNEGSGGSGGGRP